MIFCRGIEVSRGIQYFSWHALVIALNQIRSPEYEYWFALGFRWVLGFRASLRDEGRDTWWVLVAGEGPGQEAAAPRPRAKSSLAETRGRERELRRARSNAQEDQESGRAKVQRSD